METRGKKREEVEEKPQSEVEKLASLLRESLNTRWRPTSPPFQPPCPSFSGKLQECPKLFLEGMESYVESQELTDKHKIQLATSNLHDDAATWWQPLQYVPMSWEQFRYRLLNHFNSTEYRTTIRQQIFGDPQKPSETAREFIARKMAICARLPASGDEETEDRVRATMHLMRTEHRAAMRSMRPTTFDELLDHAGAIDMDFPTAAPRRTAPLRSNTAKSAPTNLPQCRYCPEKHFHRDCPVLSRNWRKRDTKPAGNGKAVDTRSRPQ